MTSVNGLTTGATAAESDLVRATESDADCAETKRGAASAEMKTKRQKWAVFPRIAVASEAHDHVLDCLTRAGNYLRDVVDHAAIHRNRNLPFCTRA